MSGASGSPGRGTRTFVAFTLRWGAALWAAVLIAAIPATWRTVQLYAHLRSEVEALLPRNAPSVLAIDELRARLPGLQHLGVVVDAGSADRLPQAERLLDDLAARVKAYPPDLVHAVRTGDQVERRFLEDHAPLYMDLADLESIRARVEARRDWEAAKETGALLDEDAPPPPLQFDDLERKYDARAGGGRRFAGDRFSSAADHTTLLLIEVGEFDSGRSRGEALLERVKADLADLRPASYAPGLRVGFTSDVAINVEETQALLADLSLSSVVVIVLVVAVIVIYYEWWRSVLVLLPPLLIASIGAFALASLPPFRVTELNSNTAFLGSIIVGNGINFGIVLLARYVEERRLGVAVQEALVRGVWGARTGTLSAALAAAVSYVSLAVTDFRGFRQFGFIGGVGMLLSWGLTFLLVPSLTAWLDRGRPPRPAHRIMPAFVRVSRAHQGLVLGLAGVLAVAAAWKVRSFGPDRIETDFSKLRRADTWVNGEGYWGRRMDDLLGTYVTPTVILTDDPNQARAIGDRLKAEEASPPLADLVASVRTMDDVVPPDQPAKIALVDQIRDDLTPTIRAALSESQRKTVDRLLGRGELRPLGPHDLPEVFTTGLRERDGSFGRTVLVFPRPGRALWEGAPLADFVSRLRAAAAVTTAPGQRAGRVAGSHALTNDILESVRRDGARACGVALVGVICVVLLLLRASRSTALVIGSLLLGVLWLAGGALALGIKINFANFIAFPITFGIGVDYAVNVASRWELDGRGSMEATVSTTGGAVALCSLTTIIGYSSLLLAQNRALFLFGLLAVLGEVACLSTALVVMPAVAEWRERGTGAPRRGHGESAA